MKLCLLLLGLVTMVWCGCASSQPRRLSKSQVIAIAQRTGIEHGQGLQGYRAPDIFFNARDKTWYVSFSPKKAYRDRYPWAAGFGVEVSDQTGNTTYREHIFR
jgi:hypothetical protein